MTTSTNAQQKPLADPIQTEEDDSDQSTIILPGAWGASRRPDEQAVADSQSSPQDLKVEGPSDTAQGDVQSEGVTPRILKAVKTGPVEKRLKKKAQLKPKPEVLSAFEEHFSGT
ncbi:hypothetical protein ABVK25_008818 [Lepraria finkii]|uniref:Uncharacterized protein n=1 Tax=Lepraria finkii TaxID=1340010 RepID=A0ABR4AZL8_9LECA